MMSGKTRNSLRAESSLIEVKSKFDAEFRRFSLVRERSKVFEEFRLLVFKVHRIEETTYYKVYYTDPIHGDLLPITNDDNYRKALSTAKPVLRLLLQRKDEEVPSSNGTMGRKKNPLSKFIAGGEARPRPHVPIKFMEDFHMVSSIIDVDLVPETHRRVRLRKNGLEKPLGFYIRDGTGVRVRQQGLEKVPAIFISRLVPGGLAESTGLLAVNDEVLEVNGIDVAGKTLDQVTDMMVANSANLIITVKPVNQRNNLTLRRDYADRQSQKSTGTVSLRSGQSGASSGDEVREIMQEDDEDEVKDHMVASEEASTHSATSGNTPSSVEIQERPEMIRHISI